MKNKKRKEDEYVGVGGKVEMQVGKGAYVGSFSKFFLFFFFFLGVTYSHVLKKQNCSNSLAIAVFLKSPPRGPPRKETYLGSFRIFGWCYL